MNFVKLLAIGVCSSGMLAGCANNPAADQTAADAPKVNCTYEAATGSNIMTHKCKPVDDNPGQNPLNSMPRQVCSPTKMGTQSC